MRPSSSRPPPGNPSRRPAARAALLAWIALLAGCPPVMIERDGHRVFNPAYGDVLDARDRDAWQQPGRVMDALGVGAGSVVADVGAASGWFTERLARRVGPTGRVYATDVQEAMLERLRARVAARGLANVEVVRAGFDDPALPAACCDALVLSSVYKELDDRVAWMQKAVRALRPGGRVGILEYRPDAAGWGPPRALRLAPAVVVRELAAAGLALVARHEFIDRQYFLVFTPAVASAAPAL